MTGQEKLNLRQVLYNTLSYELDRYSVEETTKLLDRILYEVERYFVLTKRQAKPDETVLEGTNKVKE